MNPLIPMLAITGKPDKSRTDKIFKQYRGVKIDTYRDSVLRFIL